MGNGIGYESVEFLYSTSFCFAFYSFFNPCIKVSMELLFDFGTWRGILCIFGGKNAQIDVKSQIIFSNFWS